MIRKDSGHYLWWLVIILCKLQSTRITYKLLSLANPFIFLLQKGSFQKKHIVEGLKILSSYTSELPCVRQKKKSYNVRKKRIKLNVEKNLVGP